MREDICLCQGTDNDADEVEGGAAPDPSSKVVSPSSSSPLQGTSNGGRRRRKDKFELYEQMSHKEPTISMYRGSLRYTRGSLWYKIRKVYHRGTLDISSIWYKRFLYDIKLP